MTSKETKSNPKALWLLDIDGVLNAYDRPNREFDVWPEVEMGRVTSGAQSFNLFVAPGLVAFVKEMLATDLVEILWATTWVDRANTLFCPQFDFPLLEVGARPHGFSDYGYKPRAAQAAIKAGRRLIWTDDEAIDTESRAMATRSKVEHLLIEPDPTLGLTPAHCEKIKAYILGA